MLPLIERQAAVAFRGLDPEAREDAISEVVASTLCAYRRLYEREELQRAFASPLVKYAIAQYWTGRRVGTPQHSSDVFSPHAKQNAGYEVCSLGAPGEQIGAWGECLIDERRTRIPDQVAFRLDLPCWLQRQTPRNRQIAERLSVGGSTAEVAHEFGISPARVSQLRRQLAASWNAFINPLADPPATQVTGLA